MWGETAAAGGGGGGGGAGSSGGAGSAPGGGATNLLEDPVLSSFSRCLAKDILCVWRRVSSGNGGPGSSGGPGGANNAHSTATNLFDFNSIVPSPAPPPLSLQAAKELWIFWYGDKEPELKELVSHELFGCGKFFFLFSNFNFKRWEEVLHA